MASSSSSAQCVAPPVTCSGTYRYECQGSRGVKIDEGCGATSTVVSCSATETCAVTGAGITC